MQTHHGLSARRADCTLGLSRSARHYAPRPRDDTALIEAVEAHVKDNPGHGFGLLFDQAPQPKGFGKTRSWRVYVAMELNLPRRGKRRLPDRIREPLAIPDQATPKKFQEQNRRKQTYAQPVPKNQIPTRTPQAAVNPMYSMNQGGGGVGIGPNSPLGERFGWYAEMIRKIIARNLATNGLAGTQGAPAIIGFVIARDGRVANVRLVQSSGNAAIDNSA